MIVLGINGGFRQGYQDVSACLMVNGQLIAAVSEERLNRIKFSPGKLPYLAIIEVLDLAQLKFEEIEVIAFHGSTWGQEIDTNLTNYFINYFGSCPKIERFHHHDCHAASTFYESGFDEALIITSDSSGDGVSMQISLGKKGEIKTIQRFNRPNSLGIFYSLITQYCGFWKESDEYKLMGLASNGNPDFIDFSWLIDFQHGVLTINQEYLIPFIPLAASPHKDEMLFNENFLNKLGKPRRLPKDNINQYYTDIAASAQNHFEKILIKIIKHFTKVLNIKDVCLAGGAALNGVASQRILESQLISRLFVPSSPGDDGISIGAAWLAGISKGIQAIPYQTSYLGRAFSNSEIEKVLLSCNVEYTYIEKPYKEAAIAIANDNVVAWFQGKAEFGPRALGNRSILANPCNPKMKDIVNKKIKFREAFRPFGPSVIENKASHYFKMIKEVAPYMNITFPVLENSMETIPSVIHTNQNARIQTVNANDNNEYYLLLKELEIENGHPVVLNTSFNTSKEPMVYSPIDALSTFFSTGLDMLFIGNYLVRKPKKK